MIARVFIQRKQIYPWFIANIDRNMLWGYSADNLFLNFSSNIHAYDLQSTTWTTSSSLLNCLPYVLETCLRAHVLTCLACQHAYVLTCQRILHVYVLTLQRILHVYVLTLQRILHVYVLTLQRALLAYVLTCQRALRAYVLACQRALRAYVLVC